MKNERTFMSAFELAHDVEQLVAGVVEVDATCPCRRTWPRWSRSCSPAGSPPTGMTVAATSPGVSLTVMPMFRVPKPEVDQRMADRAVRRPRPGSGGTSARPRRLTMWSASIRSSRSGTLAMCPPMTIVACG